jgi:hypothetical protein
MEGDRLKDLWKVVYIFADNEVTIRLQTSTLSNLPRKCGKIWGENFELTLSGL